MVEKPCMYMYTCAHTCTWKTLNHCQCLFYTLLLIHMYMYMYINMHTSLTTYGFFLNS